MAQPSFHGQFIWQELLCNDPGPATAFYERILPWKAKRFSPGSPYLMFHSADGKAVAGAMRLSEDAKAKGTPPHWRGYIGVGDVDSLAGQAVGLGAHVQQPAQDVPGVGRVALLTDPEGAIFGLYSPLLDSGSAPASSGFAWAELAVRNREAGLAFYRELFGWQLRPPMDMGGGFFYQTFGLGSQDFGGAYTIPADRAMPPAWCPYAISSSADETARKILATGGKVAHGPAGVPGGGRIVQFFDAEGAFFAVHSMAVASPADAGKTKPNSSARAVPAVAKKAAIKSATKAAKKKAKKATAKTKSKPQPKSKKKPAKRRVAAKKKKPVPARAVKRTPKAKRKTARAKGKAARKK